MRAFLERDPVGTGWGVMFERKCEVWGGTKKGEKKKKKKELS